ncbi:MAG: phosphoribosylanthranilate isomerase [Pseudorhodobacter sp.]
MTTDIRVKICGLRRLSDMAAVVASGASYAGLVFFDKSPRNLTIDEARSLAFAAPPGLAKVALTVNADNAFLDRITKEVPLDMLQLHGTESPERVADIKARYGLPVMKAIGIAKEADLGALLEYGLVADQILVDARPPKGAELPGGNGLSFDWRLLVGRKWLKPWMLAGGLTPDNVAEAIRLTGARQIDVSSGVESAPGIKDPERISIFIKATRA